MLALDGLPEPSKSPPAIPVALHAPLMHASAFLIAVSSTPEQHLTAVKILISRLPVPHHLITTYNRCANQFDHGHWLPVDLVSSVSLGATRERVWVR
jgi:hypothetical protein